MSTPHLLRADAELTTYYTTAFIRTQSFEWSSDEKVSDVDERLARIVDEGHHGALGRLKTIEAKLERVPKFTQRVLRAVYEPYGEPDLRALALRTPWGSGTFVRLAITRPRAAAAMTKRYPERDVLPETVGSFLRDEAGRGEHAESFFKALRSDCEEMRMTALTVYATHLKRERESRRQDLISELGGSGSAWSSR